jgi:hypothetical protein
MNTQKQISSVRFVGPVLVLLMSLISLSCFSQWSAVSNNNFNSTNTGNIGINGTVTASDAKLTITGESSVWPLSLKNSGAGGTNWIVGSSANAWATGGGKFLICNTSSSADAAFTIDAAKNVGINKTSPAYKLDVNGAVNATSYLLNGAPFTTSSQWTTSSSNIYFNTGSVGVGTATPNAAYKLDVAGPVNASQLFLNGTPITLTQWTTSSSNIYFNTGSVGVGTSTPNAAYKLDVAGPINASQLFLNGTPITPTQWTTTSGSNINYNGAGVVSIGTTRTPAGYKLAIGGKAIAEEVVVMLQGNWPDYVFEEDYKLPSLLELEKFVRENKHLPGVPTAEEVKTSGIAVGEMNALLLSKVEELTLLLIEQQKQLEEQQQKLEKLEKAFAKK